jgi:hypothetical protein
MGGRLPTFAPFFVPLFFETRLPLNMDYTPAPSPTLESTAPTISSPPASSVTKGSQQPPTKAPSNVPKKNSPDKRESTIANTEAATSSASYVSLRQPFFVCIAVVALFCV